jgi:hypothetical protein
MKRTACLLALAAVLAAQGASAEICMGYGPQTPRDITEAAGTNPQLFPIAPPSTGMNLCNIHSHTNAEHKGPGFSVFVGADEYGGYQCNETAGLTEAERAMPEGTPAYGQVKPGDTIEVHWVHTTCQVMPGPGLGSCLSDSCANPTLRVETQVFLVVNDDSALDFTQFDYKGDVVDGFHQPAALPTGTGEPVVFRGSTTGPSYTEATCSPLQVTWSVRPQCAKVSYASLQEWARTNAFDERKSHGIRQLVTSRELLSPISQ